MLQQNAVPRTAMDVLKFLSTCDFLNDFRLVGGTALALYWGHRISIDIDLFTDKKISLLEVEYNLSGLMDSVQISKNPIGLSYNIQNVKCDFLVYPYQFNYSETEEDGIRIAHIEDVIALKLGAIANRGARKDFIDLYYILQTYSLGETIRFYERMYNVKEHFSLLKSMTYFEDAENEQSPVLLLDKKLSWDIIKKEIVHTVSVSL